MKIAFFCATPYQVLLATNIAYSHYSDYEKDIYILNHFNKSESITENIKLNNPIFKHAQYIDCIEFSKSFNSSNIFKRFWRKSRAYLNFEKINEFFLDFDAKKYDEVFFSYPDIIIQMALLNLYKKNNNLIVNLFEDGTGAYSDDMTNISLSKKIFNWLINASEIIDKYHYYWLNNPMLYVGRIEKEYIKKIPKVDTSNTEFIKIINDIFHFESDYAIVQKVIFFDQPIPEFNKNTFNEVIDLSSEIFGEDFMIKLHPRTDKDLITNKNINIYKQSQQPWEVIALNSDISNKILIAHFSTALMTNKIIFDEEPIIIFLFNVKEFKYYFEIPQDLAQFAFNFKKMYSNPEKVYFPQSLAEFREIISTLKNKLF